MPMLTEGVRAGEYLISDLGSLSRDVVTIASGSGVLKPGRVLAKLSADGKYVPYDNVGSDGSEVAKAILYAGVDATSADVKQVAHTRLCEVKRSLLDWGAVDGAGQTAGLADMAGTHIIPR